MNLNKYIPETIDNINAIIKDHRHMDYNKKSSYKNEHKLKTLKADLEKCKKILLSNNGND